jgi:hypothetical protein
MDHDHTFVMLDPTTDQVLAECDGPDASGRCPMADRPPYICAGLHLIGTGDGAGHGEFTVTKMEPGRCPIAVVNQPRASRRNGMLEAEPMSRFAPTATARRGAI